MTLQDLDRAERDARAMRLAEARAYADYKSIREAARALSAVTSLIKIETYRAHENGRNGFDNAAGRIYAKFFGVDFVWLMTGIGEMLERHGLAVIGLVGAGAAIYSPHNDSALPTVPIDHIEMRIPLPHKAFGLRVVGDSMIPRYHEGDIVVCLDIPTTTDMLIGRECYVITEGYDRHLLKRVRRGTGPGLFTLESHNAEPIENIRLERAYLTWDWRSDYRHVV